MRALLRFARELSEPAKNVDELLERSVAHEFLHEALGVAEVLQNLKRERSLSEREVVLRDAYVEEDDDGAVLVL